MEIGSTIHVIDDDPSFRDAIARLLRAQGYRVVQYASPQNAVEQLVEADRGCILLDVKMEGLSGPQVYDTLRTSGCPLPVVFLTGYGDLPTSVRAIKAGAEDFLSKPISKEQLIDVIERCLERYDKELARSTELQSLRSLVATLTSRERQVFRLVVRGRLNKQIAHELGASERTIKAHRHNIMFKMGVRSVAELVSIAEKVDSTDSPGGLHGSSA